MTALPAPRRAVAPDRCPDCRACTSCRGGRAAIPRAWIPHITATGNVRALCADCGGDGIYCPTLDARQETRT